MSALDIAKSVGNVQGTIGLVKNAVQSIQSMFGVDVVGIYDNTTFQQILLTARPVKASINRQSKIMDHPIETGSIISDFSVILPVEIELSLLLTGEEYVATYGYIKYQYNSRLPMAIQTRADVFQNMIIQAMPHEETPDMMDVISIGLRLREVQIVKTQYQALPATSVVTPTDQSTVKTGTQSPSDSALYSIGSTVKNWFN